MEQTLSCCFCGKIIQGWGNDPSPVNNEEGAVCCDQCNMSRVIPARMKLMREDKNAKRS